VVTVPDDVLHLAPNARILVLRQDRIGDVLVSIPVLRALRTYRPDAEIHMVLSTNNIAVRDAVEPYVSHIHVYRKGLAGLLRVRRELRKGRYDVVIDLMDNPSSTSAMLVTAANARYAIGIDKENRGVYTHVVPRADRAHVHIVERIARLLMPFGIDPERMDLHLAFPVNDDDIAMAERRVRPDGKRRPIFGMNISGSDITRMYPEDKVIRLARHARTRFTHIETVILAAPSHREMQERIASASGCRAIEPSQSFRSWASVIRVCDAVFTPDTSTVHLAAAFDTPSVVLYVHDRADLMPWYPYGAPSWPVETSTNAIANIPVEDVMAAIESCLETV
jgi:ADP-heptose:LPS heptosyltransferase